MSNYHDCHKCKHLEDAEDPDITWYCDVEGLFFREDDRDLMSEMECFNFSAKEDRKALTDGWYVVTDMDPEAGLGLEIRYKEGDRAYSQYGSKRPWSDFKPIVKMIDVEWLI